MGAPGIVVRDVHELDAATKALGVDNTFKKPSCGLVLFCTYSSLISARRVNVPKGPKLGPLPSGPGAPVAAPQKVKRVDQLIEFLGGKDFQGLVIFDEAHRAKVYIQRGRACVRFVFVFVMGVGLGWGGFTSVYVFFLTCVCRATAWTSPRLPPR